MSAWHIHATTYPGSCNQSWRKFSGREIDVFSCSSIQSLERHRLATVVAIDFEHDIAPSLDLLTGGGGLGLDYHTPKGNDHDPPDLMILLWFTSLAHRAPSFGIWKQCPEASIPLARSLPNEHGSSSDTLGVVSTPGKK